MTVKVFITAAIDEEAMDNFLHAIETVDESGQLYSRRQNEINDLIDIVTSDDFDAEEEWIERPFLMPLSPFEGQTVEEVGDWFKQFIEINDPTYAYSFIVLDAQTMKDKTSCVIANFASEYEPVMAMRSDFRLAVCDGYTFSPFCKTSFDGLVRGYFLRSRLVRNTFNWKVFENFAILDRRHGAWELNAAQRRTIHMSESHCDPQASLSGHHIDIHRGVDEMSTIAVLCTSIIPSTVLELFLDEAEEIVDENNFYILPENSEMNWEIGDVVRFVTSYDPEQCLVPKTRPLPSFKCSFEGDTPEDIRPWFLANRDKIDEWVSKKAFIVLDSQTVKDSKTCMLVVCPNDFEPAQTMRCTFPVAFLDTGSSEYHDWEAWDGEDDRWKGRFRRSKIIMTENNRDSAQDGKFLSKVNGAWEINEGTRYEIGREDTVEYE